MSDGINVLSLFDGMSCGQIALERAGIKVANYFASEIDKYAITVTQRNYPDTIQLGDVCGVSGSDLPKIDLLIGGSPCQGFSFAGKKMNFDDPRSALFFEYVRLRGELEPEFFLLENVRMTEKFEAVVSKFMGVNPLKINSSLVSAQNRVRMYWTNIPGVKMPKDKGILLKDIIENGFVDRDKSLVCTAKDRVTKRGYETRSQGQIVFIKSRPHGNFKGSLDARDKMRTLIGSSERDSSVSLDDGRTWRKLTPLEFERLQTVPEGYTEGVSNSRRYMMLGNGWTVDVVAHIFSHMKKPCGGVSRYMEQITMPCVHGVEVIDED